MNILTAVAVVVVIIIIVIIIIILTVVVGVVVVVVVVAVVVVQVFMLHVSFLFKNKFNDTPIICLVLLAKSLISIFLKKLG
jgi:hypothetical protein